MATSLTSQSTDLIMYLNPLEITRNLWRHRVLIRQFTKREIEGRYKGSFLGLLWSFLNPLILLLIYTFVFGFIYQARWPNTKTNSLTEFAQMIFCGLTAYHIFSESVGRAPTLVVNTPNYVKKVVFPLEVLPVSVIGAALFQAIVSLSILLAANIILHGHLQWTLILLPLVTLPLITLSLGVSWLLASLGVFVRDISYTTALVLQMLFFLTPIFYTITNLPEPFQTFIRLNPLASIIEDFRGVVLLGLLPNWYSFGFSLFFTTVVMLLGYAWFMKTKKAFADVI